MRFRFTIRDLLWLTAVVALAVGWWVDRRQIQARRAEFEQRPMIVDDMKTFMRQVLTTQGANRTQ
jgi:hypothetical protein